MSCHTNQYHHGYTNNIKGYINEDSKRYQEDDKHFESLNKIKLWLICPDIKQILLCLKTGCAFMILVTLCKQNIEMGRYSI